MLTGFIRVQKTLFFLKTQPSGLFWVLLGFGLYWVFAGFLFQCAVLDAIHIK